MNRPQLKWGAAVAAVVVLVTAGLVSAVLTQYGPLGRPWSHVALVLAAVGAVSATILCVVRAHQVVEPDGDDGGTPDEVGS